MSLPNQDTLKDVLRKAHELYKAVRRDAQTIHDRSLTNDMLAERVYLFSDQCVDALSEFAVYRGVSGIGQYAKDQFGDQALEFGASVTALETAMDAYVTFAIANIPTSPNGYVETVSINQVTRKSEKRTLPSNQLVAIRTLLLDIVNA